MNRFQIINIYRGPIALPLSDVLFKLCREKSKFASVSLPA